MNLAIELILKKLPRVHRDLLPTIHFCDKSENPKRDRPTERRQNQNFTKNEGISIKECCHQRTE